MITNKNIEANKVFRAYFDNGSSFDFSIRKTIEAALDMDEDPGLEPKKFKHEDELFEGIYSGVFNVLNMMPEAYEFQYLNVMGGVAAAFGLPSDFRKDSARWASAVKYKQNIEFFSGSKEWQHHKDLSAAVFTEDGTKRSFKLFREEGLKINDSYNINWLKTEQNSAFRIAQSAETWHIIEEEKKIFPYLEYVTVGDARVRSLHASWSGIVKPVTHEFWKTRHPPNDWACRCIVIQLREAEATNLKKHLQDYNRTARVGRKINSLKNTSAVFSNNAGTSGVIFNKKHPYYKISNAFKDAQRSNFNFTTPSDSEVKKYNNGSN